MASIPYGLRKAAKTISTIQSNKGRSEITSCSEKKSFLPFSGTASNTKGSNKTKSIGHKAACILMRTTDISGKGYKKHILFCLLYFSRNKTSTNKSRAENICGLLQIKVMPQKIPTAPARKTDSRKFLLLTTMQSWNKAYMIQASMQDIRATTPTGPNVW